MSEIWELDEATTEWLAEGHYCERCGVRFTKENIDEWREENGKHIRCGRQLALLVCNDCFEKIIAEIIFEEKWNRIRALGFHLLDDLEEGFEPYQRSRLEIRVKKVKVKFDGS